MERGAEVEVIRQQLMGLVALLLSLAALADRAASIPPRARARSLIHLRRAEWAFLCFIAEVTGSCVSAPDGGGDSEEDAIRLANRLRGLAIVIVMVVLPILVAGSGQGAGQPVALPGVASRALPDPVRSPVVSPFDTS